VYFEFEDNWGDWKSGGGFCGNTAAVAVSHVSWVSLRGQVSPPLLVVIVEKHECVWAYLPPPHAVLLVRGEPVAEGVL